MFCVFQLVCSVVQAGLSMCLLAFVGFECVLLILYDVARRGEFLRDSRVANVYYDLANAGDRRYCFNNEDF